MGAEHETITCTHGLAESYATLTTIPTYPKVSPREALRMLTRLLDRGLTPTALTVEDYHQTLNTLAERSLPGGVVYDAWIAQLAHRMNVDRLVTFNRRDFDRVWPGKLGVVREP